MENTKGMPLWVFLAFSSIETRRGAWILIYACAAFTLYCLPWPLFFPAVGWVATLFLIDDWSWIAMMIPMIGWYLLSLRWVDKNGGWVPAVESKD